VSALKKERKKYEEIKRGKCPKTRRKQNVRQEEKMANCPTVELGVQDTHLREKKKKIYIYRASHSLQKASKCNKGISPPKSKCRIRLPPMLHHHHHTPFIPHTCTSRFDLLTCFCGP